jgi:transcriptional regulator with XRE-family HTH domain
MDHCAKLRAVTDKQRPNDPRWVLGQLVRQLIARGRLDKTDVAARAGIGRTTLWRLIEGDPTVTVETMSAVEYALDQPFGLFRLVAERDVSGIRNLARLDENFRSWIIGALSTEPDAPRTRVGRRRTA